jgi:3-oxoacyl-[acyl-carrier-protein] synthase II
VQTDRCRRRPGEATEIASRQLDALRGQFDPAQAAVLSGACGVADATTEELGFLTSLGLPVRAVASALGHSVEPSFPATLALAAISVARGRLFAPLEPREQPMDAPLRQALVTGWGQWRGEALALVTAA